MKYFLYRLIISIITSTTVWPAFAEECYEQSPNLVDNENEYYDLVVKEKLSRDEKKKLKILNKSLIGKWRGQAAVIECFGTERNPKSKKDKSKVKATINSGTGNVAVVKAELYISAKKITKSASLHLFRSDNMFNVDFSGDNNIAYAERLRKKTRNGSQFLETINSIQLNDGKLNLKLNHYMNGVLIAYEKWSLTKK